MVLVAFLVADTVLRQGVIALRRRAGSGGQREEEQTWKRWNGKRGLRLWELLISRVS